MKQSTLLLGLFFFFSPLFAQKNQWTWVAGDLSGNHVSVYGVRGVAAPDNRPGSRILSLSWTDASGNLWLFGGTGYTSVQTSISLLNDLWKYTPATGLWTWVGGDTIASPPAVYGIKGMAASGNRPGGRLDATGWTDGAGNLWLFGGQGYGAGLGGWLNDLWKYNLSTNQWTWVSGDMAEYQGGIYGTRGMASPANKPGSRVGSVSWADALGNLWLFGGTGYAASGSALLNDLWKYNIASGLWTWVSGDSINAHLGIYGTQGIAAPANKPGSRTGGIGWIDATGTLWLFGGTGYALNRTGDLNDLWKYTPATGEWTWVSGDFTPDLQSVYGTKGMAAAGNKPGGRWGGVGCTDAAGNFWLFGGTGYNGVGGTYENDLWKYTPSTGLWTWVGGDNTSGQAGVYGMKGVPAATNKPGARYDGVGWGDAAGHLWLFGGNGYGPGSLVELNDLWRYTLSDSSLSGQLNGFVAQQQQQHVLLNWTTTAEQNSLYFVVERTAAGASYDSVGMVSAAGAIGTSASYQYTDNNPLTGTNMYRIKQVGIGNTFKYSAIAKVVMNDPGHVSIIQNPVQSALQINVQLPSSQKLTLQISDMNGHVLLQEEHMALAGNSVYSIAVNRLVRGTYLIRVKSASMNSTQPFIKP